MSSNNTNAIPAEIKRVREIRGISQEYLGCKMGISQNAVSKLESGKTPLTLRRLFEICTILDISCSVVIDGEQLPKNDNILI